MDDDEDIFVLSPFEVTADDSTGYNATSSLAGTRIKTDLKDIASSISVVTKDFLKDTGATDNQSLLTYTTNTEVSGVGGNFAGVGSTFAANADDSGNLLRPNNNTRVRGLSSADNTRDYFKSDIPWDSYNVERVELQRGPNSILFGFGSPSGIINTSTNQAFFGNESQIELGFGSFGTIRATADFNKTLIEDELAIRVNVLKENQKYRQKPAHEDDQRLYAAIRWTPKFLNTDAVSSTIKASYETGEIDANRPRILPPEDRISAFFDEDALNQETYDPYYAWEAGIIGYPGSVFDGATKNPWIVQYPGPGLQMTSNAVFNFDGSGASSPSSWSQATPTTSGGINSEGGIDGGIDGFPFGSNIGIGGFTEYAYNAYRQDGSYPGSAAGFWKNTSLTDTSVFDFYNNLIDGPNKREWQNWNSTKVSFEQTFWNNNLGYELVLDKQSYDDGQTRNLNQTYISVDIRENIMQYPWAYEDDVVANPNAGRAFVGSSTRGTSNASFRDRETRRATAYADIDLQEIFGESQLTKFLGKHMFNGVYSDTTFEFENRSWVRYALDSSWVEAYGGTDLTLTSGDRSLDWITYISDDLRGLSSASGLNLSGISATQSLSGTYSISYFDPTWNSSVDPGAAWTNPTVVDPAGSSDSTQSENPLNYVGWTTADFTILNADEGDIDQLYTSIGRVRETTESKAITWQGKLLGGLIIPTWGYREDSLKSRSGTSTIASESDGIPKVNPTLGDYSDPATESSTSWGVVVHSPEFLNDKLPWDSSFSAFYNEGENWAVETRYNFDGGSLPNQHGTTEEYGFTASMFNERLRFKATHYETIVEDANISTVTTETTSLGNNTYYLRMLEAWGTGSALLDLAGREVSANPDAYTDSEKAVQGWSWYWNWALVDGNSVEGAEGLPGAWSEDYNDVTSDAYLTHPSTIAQTEAINSWLSQIEDQSWYDAYGFAVDVEAAKAGDWQNAVEGWDVTTGIGFIQPAGGGTINGYYPTALVDYVSEGWEYELVGNLTENWSVSINASKTDAYQTALGEEFVGYLESTYTKYQTAAGDLRLWWGGDVTLREYFQNNIWTAYQFQLETLGKTTPELSPWSVNIITNYNFTDGKFSGLNIGGGFRWKDGKILGYALNEAQDNLDVEKPYWSDSEEHFDIWLGKDIALNDKVDWRIQVNLRNVGEDPELKPLSVQPDGSYAAYSIQEGMTWNVTNTFSF